MLLSACSPGATLTTRDGWHYRGRPVTNDETHVWIDTAHYRYKLCKRDVVDADHAGNGMAYIGGAVALTGIVGTALIVHDESVHPTHDPNGPGFAPVTVAMALTGLALAIAGFGQWNRSRQLTGLPASPETLDKPCTTPPSPPGSAPGRQFRR